MKCKYLMMVFVLSLCANANAEWFLRGTHNAWAADQMGTVGVNTVGLSNVVFSAAGNIKFDRFGDWKENYGVGGSGGGNIPVAAGTWDIKFFTDTKNWSITPSLTAVDYFIRGTFNTWAADTKMARLGTSNVYESCINFIGGDTGGGPRFKIDPNGNWGDAIPAADFMVFPGWVRIHFDALSKAITVEQNLASNCGAMASSSSSSSSIPTVYHLRGTFNSWNEGTLMTQVGATAFYESCVEFKSGDAQGSPRFKIDPNGNWGDAIPANDFVVSLGWVKISLNSSTKSITVQQNLATNCGVASSSSSSSAPAFYLLRGTFNHWAEDTTMTQVDSTPVYESCQQFVGGDTGGGARFKIDPNGGWGFDALPAGDFMVSEGWVKVSFNSATKAISVQQNLAANCMGATSSSSTSSSSTPTTVYHLRGTFNGWAEGTLLTQIGTTNNYEFCQEFKGGDGGGGPRFKIDPNGGWGDAIPPGDFNVSTGWVKILFNSSTKAVNVQNNVGVNCVGATSSSSSSTSSTPTTTYHLRGTFNGWADGVTIMDRVGTTAFYESCVNFIGGDMGGGPRFKVDPNGGWGDAVPATDFMVNAGWVKVSFNSSTKAITVQQNLSTNCGVTPASYHLRGTFNSWADTTEMTQVGTSNVYKSCQNFVGGDTGGGPRFKIDPNGLWGDAIPANDFVVLPGWVEVSFDSSSKVISVRQNLASNCL